MFNQFNSAKDLNPNWLNQPHKLVLLQAQSKVIYSVITLVLTELLIIVTTPILGTDLRHVLHAITYRNLEAVFVVLGNKKRSKSSVKPE